MLRPGAQVAPVCGKIPVIRSCHRRYRQDQLRDQVITGSIGSLNFEMRNSGNELYPVLAVLKNLKRLVLQEQNGAR